MRRPQSNGHGFNMKGFVRQLVGLMLTCVGSYGALAAEPSAPSDAASSGAPAAEHQDNAEAGGDRAAADDFRLRPGLFHLDLAEAYFGFESDFQKRRVRYTGDPRFESTQENRDLELREYLGLELAGDVVDPNLLDWRANLEFGLEQTWFDEWFLGRHDRDRDTGFLLDYDVAFDALKTKPVSFHGYGRRSDARVPRRFLPSLREERTEWGISALAVYGSLTTEIGFEWSDIERYGNDSSLDDESLDDYRFYLDSTWEIGEAHKLRVFYDHEREESTYQGSPYDFETSRDEIRIEHELGFGPGKKHQLDTYLRYNDEQGDLARDEIEFVPRLSLQHTDAFRTVYRYGFYRVEEGAIEVDQHKFDMEALYKPNDRFRLSVDGFGLYERVDQDIETHEAGGGIDVSFRQPTPVGEFRANAAFAASQSRTHGDAGHRLVRGEAHQLSTVRTVFLKNRDVLRSTILAHDGRRTRVYVPGLDYLILQTGRKTALYRLQTGRIGPEDVVYFDYQYVVPTHSQIADYRYDLLLEHEFNFGLTPYYYLESRCQEVETSLGSPWGRDNQHRHRFGLRYDQTHWYVSAEYEIFDDTVEPFDAVHLTGQWSALRSADHSLDVRGELSRYWFEGGVDRRRVWWAEVDVEDAFTLNRYWSLTNSLIYHFEDDSIDGQTHGVDYECGVRFVRGLLTVELTGEYDLLTFAQSRENSVALWLNVRRDLGSLLAKAED
jgi:hypothetical protein